MKLYSKVVTLAIALGGFFTLAQADIITSDPSLPPVAGHYRTAADVHAAYPPTPIELKNIIHHGFTNIIRTPVGFDEHETFDSQLDGIVLPPNIPIHMDGPVEVVVFNKVGNITGTFNTEMLSMMLSGGGALVRESPTLPSTGQTTITDVGGGLFRIDSFFDVFTELSLDNGLTWIPSQGSTRVTLSMPEPGTYVMLTSLLALGMVAARRRRIA